MAARVRRYRARTGRDPLAYFAIGDAAADLARIAAYVEAGVSKFILRPVARGDADVLAQTRRLIEDVLPRSPHAGREPRPRHDREHHPDGGIRAGRRAGNRSRIGFGGAVTGLISYPAPDEPSRPR